MDAPSDGAVATVEHAMGTTDVPCTLQRVVTLGQGQAGTTLALGVPPVGVVDPRTEDGYGYPPPELAEGTSVGSELEPSLEVIASPEPDVILGSELRQNDAVFGIDEDHGNLGGGLLAANAMMDDLGRHFLEAGGAGDALPGG